jgi:hypothetical protein
MDTAKPGSNVIKHLTAIIYERLKYAWLFMPGRPRQPSLRFAVKVTA